MKKIIFVFCFSVLIFEIAFPQKEGINWFFGGSNLWSDTSVYSVVNVNFNSTPVYISKIKQLDEFYIDNANATYSSKTGEFLLFSNGIHIVNKNFEIIENGENLPNSSQFSTVFPEPQGVLFLPYPNHPDTVVFLMSDIFSFYYTPGGAYAAGSSNLTYSLISLTENANSGKVVLRKSNLIQDTLCGGQTTATRHGNGRDWWVISSKYNSNHYFRTLLSTTGISLIGEQILPAALRSDLGQSVFSPDGNWYLRYNTVAWPYSSWLDIYKFNRCTGELSDQIHLKMADEVKPGGVCVSSNSKYAYVSAWDSLFQFDLHANNILDSKALVDVYDGFEEVVQIDSTLSFQFPVRFYFMQLASDGRIFICAPNFPSSYFHIINQPNLPGQLCNFEQHSFKIPVGNSFSIPNIPNFSLGALPGSPCDSLTAIEPPPLAITPLVAPNPTSGLAIMNFSDAFTGVITVYDAAGKLLQQSTVAAQMDFHLDLNWLPDGVYSVRVISTDGRRAGVSAVVKNGQ